MIMRRTGNILKQKALYSGFINTNITITNNWAYGQADSYLTLPIVIPYQEATTWEWSIRMIMTDINTNSDMYLIVFPVNYEWKSLTFGYFDQTDSKAIKTALSTNGTSWYVVPNLVLNPTLNIIYNLKFGFDGTQYYLKHKFDNDINYTIDSTYTNSTKTMASVAPILLNCGHDISLAYWHGSIDLNNTYLIIDDILYWKAY